jgi:predicted amino acid-binding ACT domain protein
MKSVTIVSEDRVGLLADISYVLGKSSINIESLDVEVVGGKAIIVLEHKDQKKAALALMRSGFMMTDPEAIVIKAARSAKDQITEMLEDGCITITDFSVLSKDDYDGVYAINVDKPRKASKMLGTLVLGHEISAFGD